jgi:hypothetical protein
MNSNPETTLPFAAPAQVKPRDLKVARQLARCSPGLGHIYSGDIIRGLAFLAAADAPLILGALLLVAPWGNVWVALGLFVMSIAISQWSTVDARRVVLRTRADYRMKDYNHWLAYTVIAVIPTVAIATAVSVALLTTHSRTFVAARSLPAASVQKGDLFAEWRSAYQHQHPQKGDRITYLNTRVNGETYLGSVAGVPGDTVSTASGSTVVPEGSLAVQRGDSPTGTFLISEMAVTGKLVYRLWPLSRAGSMAH